MDATVITVPAQLVYMNIPASELRYFVDGLFPKFAKNTIADATTGYWHRYKHGHDLLIDVSQTFSSHGPIEGAKHFGHILLTDFPTKAGIPIPGFSQSGLGSLLEQAGIHRGWMNMSLFDSGVSILCIAEGASDLSQAITGTLHMSWGSFFDTFVEGGIEIGLSVTTQNPFLFIAGIENVLAGIVATWNKLTVYVNPLDFFGTAGTSALIGFGLAYGLADESLSDASIDGVRAGAVGAFFSLSPAFGYGALAGIAAFQLGKSLAKIHNYSMRVLYDIDEHVYHQLLYEMCQGNIHLSEFLDRAVPRITLVDNNLTFQTQSRVLDDKIEAFPEKTHTLNSNLTPLSEKYAQLIASQRTLPEDSLILSGWYQRMLDQND